MEAIFYFSLITSITSKIQNIFLDCFRQTMDVTKTNNNTWVICQKPTMMAAVMPSLVWQQSRPRTEGQRQDDFLNTVAKY